MTLNVKMSIDESSYGRYPFCMEVSFANKDFDRLETDPRFTAGFPKEIVRAYRKRMQVIRSAEDERTFYALKSLRYEKLKGKRSHQKSMRLNDQWRLIIQVKQQKQQRTIVIVGIEDYHR